MTLGPGKYDKIATWVLERSKAEIGCAVIILGGEKGHGFSLKLATGNVIAGHRAVADALRFMAAELEAVASSMEHTS